LAYSFCGIYISIYLSLSRDIYGIRVCVGRKVEEGVGVRVEEIVGWLVGVNFTSFLPNRDDERRSKSARS
jgi:hypothetical protein